MYFFIDKSDFEVILNTCNKIDKPPKPSKNAHIIILIVKFLEGIELASDTPFVSSIRPTKIDFIKLGLIFNRLQIGLQNINKISII